ncbi:MAG: radical SAM protein [Deltaproteobacteria bacterium]|nr:radical SAM protein [Deltaproteobacteria bacterium]MBW2339529.1 radical SAM protein [Deltaproteobacteria bacterium]
MLNEFQLDFEQGPIRPPNEARSLLLRITRNCPWNQCLFCPVYKGQKFSLRTVEEIKKDIQTARDCADDIKALSWKIGESGQITYAVINHIVSNHNYSYSYKSVAMWLYYGTGECFLQDADNFIIKTKDFVEILRFLREKFPDLKRVTTYSRSRTVSRKSLDEMKEVKQAGLDRVHIGLETGYDPLLKFIKKGVTAAQHVDAGRKVIDAGMSLSEYIMPGLGGEAMWREHATETAKVLNQINPQYIRLRSLRVPNRTLLYQKLVDGEFKMLTDDQVVAEIKLFIETLDDNLTSTVTSDHIMNLLEEIRGKLPDEKEHMLEVIKKYQDLPEAERLIYRIGRRGGLYSSTDDLYRDQTNYDKIKKLVSELAAKGPDETESMINEMANQYV